MGSVLLNDVWYSIWNRKAVGACDVPSLAYDTPAVILGGEDSSGLGLQLDESQKPSLPGLPSLWVEDSCRKYRESNRIVKSPCASWKYLGCCPLKSVEVVDWVPEVYPVGFPFKGRWVP